MLNGIVGFDRVEWKPDTTMFHGVNALDFFQRRLERLVPQLSNDNLRAGFVELSSELCEKAAQAGGMEVPYYRLTACKGY